MHRFILTALCACSLVLGSLTLTGCNTIAGIGQDTRETGDVLTGTPPVDAYHQQARDF
jgi:predicted small secreted protein